MKLVINEVFLIERVDEKTFYLSQNGKEVRILIESAIFLHKGLQLNINEGIKTSFGLEKPFKILVSGAIIADLEKSISIIALVVELDTPLDQTESNSSVPDITEISNSGIEEVDEK